MRGKKSGSQDPMCLEKFRPVVQRYRRRIDLEERVYMALRRMRQAHNRMVSGGACSRRWRRSTDIERIVGAKLKDYEVGL
jgi:hypothetical protein